MLLLDENLSPRLIARICQVFSGCVQVLHASLDNSPDIDIWHYAKEHNLIIVTKDKDFLHFANKHGFPPKLIYLNIGNAKLATVESSLIGHKVSIDAFRVQNKIVCYKLADLGSKEEKLPPLTQSLRGIMSGGKELDEESYKQHLEDKYL